MHINCMKNKYSTRTQTTIAKTCQITKGSNRVLSRKVQRKCATQQVEDDAVMSIMPEPSCEEEEE